MANNPGKLLFGLETEFGFTLSDDQGTRVSTSAALVSYLQVCAGKFAHLPGHGDGRMFLPNGSLLYPDLGHPEYATAESSSPVALLQSLRAGESMLADAAAELESRNGIGSVALYRNNVDYSVGTTWGSHESYHSYHDPAGYASKVLGHLVSRILFTGSGGFNSRGRDATFVLSPRVAHLNEVVGRDSRQRRAIFSLRDEPLSKQHHRVHLICGEPNCSELSTYLRTGTTALVLAMADAGVDFGKSEHWLTSPLNSMGRFSMDSKCIKRIVCSDRKRRTAIDIQRYYLELAETHCHAPYMPTWAEEVCVKWRDVLLRLEVNPDDLIGSLDWPTKLALFKQHVKSQSSLSWDSLAVWTKVVASVSKVLATKTQARPRVDSHQVKTALLEKGAGARLLKGLTRTLDRHDLVWDELDAFQDVRDELCELDIRYSQLYPSGIFIELEKAGETRDTILVPDQIKEAIARAPAEGRARNRGDWIRLLTGNPDQFICDWTGIHGEKVYLDLGDPFAVKATWQAKTENGSSKPLERLSDSLSDLPTFLRS